MIPLRTRSDLIALAARSAPTAAVRRSLLEKGARVFRIADRKGWIVQSHSGRLIGVWADEINVKYVVDQPAEVPAGAEEIRGVWL